MAATTTVVEEVGEVELVKSRRYLSYDALCQAAGTTNATTLAERIGVNRRSVARWKRDGIPYDSADNAAIRVSSHPDLVWPNEWRHGQWVYTLPETS